MGTHLDIRSRYQASNPVGGEHLMNARALALPASPCTKRVKAPLSRPFVQRPQQPAQLAIDPMPARRIIRSQHRPVLVGSEVTVPVRGPVTERPFEPPSLDLQLKATGKRRRIQQQVLEFIPPTLRPVLKEPGRDKDGGR